jgi:hypothetical protein
MNIKNTKILSFALALLFLVGSVLPVSFAEIYSEKEFTQYTAQGAIQGYSAQATQAQQVRRGEIINGELVEVIDNPNNLIPSSLPDKQVIFSYVRDLEDEDKINPSNNRYQILNNTLYIDNEFQPKGDLYVTILGYRLDQCAGCSEDYINLKFEPAFYLDNKNPILAQGLKVDPEEEKINKELLLRINKYQKLYDDVTTYKISWIESATIGEGTSSGSLPEGAFEGYGFNKNSQTTLNARITAKLSNEEEYNSNSENTYIANKQLNLLIGNKYVFDLTKTADKDSKKIKISKDSIEKHYLVTDNKTKQIKPLTKVLEENKISRDLVQNDIELVEEQDDAYYVAKIKQSKKLFGFIPIGSEIVTKKLKASEDINVQDLSVDEDEDQK